jgi:hypothetical protein
MEDDGERRLYITGLPRLKGRASIITWLASIVVPLVRAYLYTIRKGLPYHYNFRERLAQ